MKVDLISMASFGVAGNFTGHLEQAGELKDFLQVKTVDVKAPKALFPTYLPEINKIAPSFLSVFPFSDSKIKFPEGEEKLQIEPECGIIFEVEWSNDKIVGLKPICFGASNDCSIRKDGAKKISEKKNWGRYSKGLSDILIPLDDFTEKGILKDYRIASFLLRDDVFYDYGEDSPVSGYSYMYDTLVEWIIDRLNNQKNEGPAEDLHSYLSGLDKIKKIFVSIGATRYTEFGEHNYLKNGDEAIVVLYPELKYTSEEIKKALLKNIKLDGVSVLRQVIYQ